MIDLKLSIILGSILERIRDHLGQLEELYLGILINSLRYSDAKSGAEEKKKYIASLKNKIEKINKEVRSFNFVLRATFGTKHKFEKLPEINFTHIRKIVMAHKGDYPEDKGVSGLSNFSEELFGETNSASSLARKHTALQIRNILLPLRQSLGKFVKSLDILEEPYTEYSKNSKKLRTKIADEINKSKACYSIHLRGEAVFIIGRALENLCYEWLTLLKRQKKFKSKIGQIERKTSFETKINILGKIGVITPSQRSKLLSIKWDRNDFGHSNQHAKKIENDADISIRTGIKLIFLIESKLSILKKK